MNNLISDLKKKGLQGGPIYTGIPTFLRMPMDNQLKYLDIALSGVPFDLGSAEGSGSRFAPQEIREGLHSEDTWIALEIARKYGWKAVEVITEAQVFFSPTSNWIDFLKQESRFEQGFSQLVECFPELEEVYDRRREGKIIPSREEVGDQVRRRLEEVGISQTRFKELLDIINPIIEENSQMLENKLIDLRTGTWEQVKSTKEY